MSEPLSDRNPEEGLRVIPLQQMLGAAGTAILIFLVISYGLSLRLAESYPSVSRTFYDSQEAAIASIGDSYRANQLSAEAPPAIPADRFARLSRKHVNNEPLSVAAFRSLALLARQASSSDSPALLRHAIFLAKRDLETQLLLTQQSLSQARYEEAARQLDILLRVYPRLQPRLFNILRTMTDDPKARLAVVKLLRSNPPWRSAFLNAYPNEKRRQDIAIAILLELGSGATRATDEERNRLMQRLIAWQSYDKAAYLWLQSQSEEKLANVPTIRNGEFENPIQNAPFSWQIGDVPGASTLIVQETAPRNRVLSVSFVRQRVPYQHTRQFLMLYPGAYRFSALYRATELRSVRGLAWRIYCLGTKRQLIFESQRISGTQNDWSDLNHNFEIPAEDCHMQLLQLENTARNSPEQMISGEVFFDKLRITRRDTP